MTWSSLPSKTSPASIGNLTSTTSPHPEAIAKLEAPKPPKTVRRQLAGTSRRPLAHLTRQPYPFISSACLPDPKPHIAADAVWTSHAASPSDPSRHLFSRSESTRMVSKTLAIMAIRAGYLRLDMSYYSLQRWKYGRRSAAWVWYVWIGEIHCVNGHGGELFQRAKEVQLTSLIRLQSHVCSTGDESPSLLNSETKFRKNDIFNFLYPILSQTKRVIFFPSIFSPRTPIVKSRKAR